MSIAEDIAGMERELLLDPDPSMLGVYADMLEDAGLCGAAEDVRSRLLDAADPDYVSGRARHVCDHGYATHPLSTRNAVACLIDASHPVESAELRLSIASGEWPCLWRRAAHGPVRRYREGGPQWTFWIYYEHGSTRPACRYVATWRHGSWEEEVSGPPPQGETRRRDAAVRAAAREWLAQILAGE